MAEKGKRQYNLRSVSYSVQLPVQIHMASDAEFLSKLSNNQQNSDAGESEISDLNCSALVESSDDEQIPCGQNILRDDIWVSSSSFLDYLYLY